MASLHVTQVSHLLGRTVLLTEALGGVQIERRGVVTAYTKVMPGRSVEEFLLEQEDGDSVFYSLDQVQLHHIE